MLVPLVLSPYIFNFESLEENEQLSYYFELLHFFEKAFKRGVILIDREEILSSYIYENINKISSVKYRNKIRKGLQACLQKYKKVGRIAKVNVRNSCDSENFSEECKSLVALVNQEKNSSIVYNNECNCNSEKDCKNCIVDNSDIFERRLHSFRDLEGLDLDKTSYSVVPESFNIYDIENKIFKTLFRYSKFIEIYDRQITGENRDPRILIRESHKKNLVHWMKLMQRINPTIEVKVYSLISENQLRDINRLKRLIKEFENYIVKETGANFKLIVFKEKDSKTNQYSSAIHNRYIFSNRINFAIDRGLDLIKHGVPDTIRDFHVSLVDRADAVGIKRYIENLQKLV